MANRPFSLAVKALVRNERDEVLWIRRHRDSSHFAGQWDLPGGKVDPGEDFTTALEREVREETGLDVELTALAGASQDDMPTVRVVLLYMEARLLGGDLRVSAEHEEAAWVARHDVADLDVSGQLRPFTDGYLSGP